ncbi:MAG TPA: type II toxin-antitoxin system RelE/ParE family toxin [Frankiaceae bacterium]|jgi:mRNA-degrading endonuclease RelE of RelBE toxin-antitoxin system|nr:type II toxin-antitoxin system RelE/ParE family toxin [Frankiaceae bacterium]
MPDAYGIEWAPSARRDLAKLREKIATAVVEFIYGGLADNPQRVGRELHLELRGLHSARRGDFRVIYRIDDARDRVVVIAIDHRADIYRRR